MNFLHSTLICLLLGQSLLQAADWPTFLHDNRRSGVTTEQLDAATLTQTWVFAAPARPQPAWRGKMVRDSYAKRTFQSDSFDYDKAFNLIVAEGKVFFGSSSGNACVALSATTGAELWRVPVGGAVRVAPAYDAEKIYFGSDDGQAYCVNATTGAAVWAYRGGPSAVMIASDHKFLSRYPCRTGVLVQNGKAYCGFGLLTWHTNYLVKLDAASGAEEHKTLRSGSNYSFEGTMLADGNNLYVTQGRNSPVSFSLANASYLGKFPGCGGTYATLTAAGALYHGPGHNTGNRTDHMVESNASSRSENAKHNYMERIVVDGSNRYAIQRDVIQASGGNSWTQAMERPRSIILGGSVVYVGGRNLITAYDSATGTALKSLTVDGDVYCLALANGGLFASTHSGRIYCFR